VAAAGAAGRHAGLIEEVTMTVFDLHALQADVVAAWKNFDIALVNGNAVRLRVMENKTANWHHHATSDELFYVVSGSIFIDTEVTTHALQPGQLVVVPAGMEHRARAPGRATMLVIDQIQSPLARA
jgi:mannose-6-phosphate isomerase-like protein (cupin superfamily)